MNKQGDTLWIGLITGVISPPVAFLLFCFFAFPDSGIMEILEGYIRRNVLTHVISLSVIINLPLFFGYLGSGRDRAAQGVVGATFLFAFLILILKLIG
jgi:TM2 domain-containing membrane protein YozV